MQIEANTNLRLVFLSVLCFAHTHKTTATRLIRSNESGHLLGPASTAAELSHRVRAHSMGASSASAGAAATAVAAATAAANQVSSVGLRQTAAESRRRHLKNTAGEIPAAAVAAAAANVVEQKHGARVASGGGGTRGSDFRLLAKNSFTCLLIGSRQTGKRTIVKCFVKLVNEFRLAAEEYRKEKILTKLMDCSERLQALAKQQDELEQQEQERERHQTLMGTSNHPRRQSRLNSWLGGKLLPAAGNKLRLHSLVPTSTTPTSFLSAASAQPADQQRQHRRHTAIEPVAGFNLCGGGANRPRASLAPQMLTRDGIGRHSTKERRRPTEFLVPDSGARLSCCNKSDFNINYLDTAMESQPASSQQEYIVMSQLQVPSSGSRCAGQLQSTQFLNTSTSSLCKPAGGDNQLPSSSSSSPMAARASQSHSPTRICINANDDEMNDAARRRRSSANPHPPQRISTHHPSRQPTPGQQARQTTVSLKEINRRRIRVRFSTRRQLSDKLVSYLSNKTTTTNPNHPADNNNNNDSSESENNPHTKLALPDSIMVVYSVNDR